MKKQFIILFTLITISVVSFISCEPFIDNNITIKNQAEGDVQFIMAGKTYNVLSNTSLILPKLKKGTFIYETIYAVPSGIAKATAEGDVAGNMVLNAGTAILLQYTSIRDDSSYTIYGILSSSDDVNRVDPVFDGGTP